ncbi:cytochrome c biogenesis protein ResB [Xylophilus sp. GOD-11R]|uniref:cytochrome c biogenesis protein ResB n=1 Tax=Xylophilus sp. GOD-11R TaxID=3089814 RepID=UPI00298D4D77|nr:cytochrome c biogenesis protein ResB [Xylophilus sp. GOD-11R]WPB57568.1 cytochrome c biogenesis protein ResB [Xylophilus sp. GOD-11R]
MSVSTHGIRVRSGSSFLRAAIELMSSMRFAISLLSVICIASIIGTVLQQQQPYGNYVNQFGPFWAEVFDTASLYRVYSAWWFLLILAFLVTSTSLCIWRSVPKIVADLRAYKENLRVQSLRAFGQRAEAGLDDAPEDAARRLGGALVGAGWKVKLQERSGDGWMLAAKAGAANKLGYIAAHGAIVLICIGGLLDGDLVVRAQMLLHGKSAYRGGGMIADVAPQHRLSPSNPTFRGNLMVPEGSQSGSAILNQADGILVQDLPFSIELKKFVVEHYSTGMPKLFASDIVIHDRITGEAHSARVEVNHPVSWRGVDIYQSSFDDGGSKVKLKALPMHGTAAAFDVEGTIGSSTALDQRAGGPYTLEYGALRTINVENFGKGGDGAVDVRKVDLRHELESRIGAPNRPNADRSLRNVGPSITYRLRDAAGQALEFQNYMLPVELGDGVPVFLFGMRSDAADAFRYLRLPADENGSVDGFMRLHAALADPGRREAAVRRYAQASVDGSRPELVQQLQASASRALALFAGNPQAPAGTPEHNGGLQAISAFMEANVPEGERARAGEVLVRILNGALFELLQQTRRDAGLAPLDAGDATARAFMTQSVLSLGDMAVYPVPLAFRLDDFEQVQASVFQVARAPGRIVVYTGCVFLIVGVFSMLFVRERRLWIWLAPDASGGSQATMALSSNRKTLDGEREFERLRERLLGAAL